MRMRHNDSVQCYEMVDFASSGMRKTADGYLIASPRIARTGVQTYKGWELGDEREVVRVYRPEAEVFAPDAMTSLAWKTLTLDHPSEMVNARNWKEFTVGHTSGDVARDGEFIRVPLIVMDGDAIDAVESGKMALSVGYGARIVWEPGMTPGGEHYDAKQTQIRGNHVAIVDVARGGPKLRLVDAAMPEINNEADLREALAACNAMQEGGGKDAMYAHIEQRARALGLENMLPDSACEDGHDSYFDREFSTAQRQQAAAKGQALPHGGFPIKNEKDLRNAIRAIGRAKNRAATIAHIKKRARALGLTSLIPAGWGDSMERRLSMERTINLDGVNIALEDKDGQILERHLKSLADKVAALEGKLTTSEKSVGELTAQVATVTKSGETKDGEITALKKQLADKEITPKMIDDAVVARMDVVRKATAVFGDRYVIDNKTDGQIRREVVAHGLGDETAKAMSDDAIIGAFSALTAKVTAVQPAPTGFQRTVTGLSQPLSTGMSDGVKAYEERNALLSNAWKKKSATAA